MGPRRSSRQRFGWVASWLLLLAISPLLLTAGLCYVIVWPFRELLLRIRWSQSYGRQGKRFLVLYSDSPKSKELIERELVPVLGDFAVVVNKSTDPRWKQNKSLVRRAGNLWAAGREPLVVFLPALGRKKCFHLGAAIDAHWYRKDDSQFTAELQRITSLASRAASGP